MHWSVLSHDALQRAPIGERVVHTLQRALSGRTQPPPRHCAPTPQEAPSARSPGGGSQISSHVALSEKKVSHVKLPSVAVHVWIRAGESFDPGAASRISQRSFLRSLQVGMSPQKVLRKNCRLHDCSTSQNRLA